MRKFLYGISNLIYYFKAIWNDRPYDYASLLSLMELKMRRMGKWLGEEYNGTSMLACAGLCRRIINDNYRSGESYWDDREKDKTLLFYIMNEYLYGWWN